MISGRIRKPPSPEEIQTRQQFLHNLAVLNDVYLVNHLDNESPPLDFRFIEKSVLGPGVERATEDVMLGCGCQKQYKQPYGCVYLDYCTCIEDSAVDNKGKKSFPYGASKDNYRCLRPMYLNSRNHIYECNSRCDCTENCKNRVVQHGRQVKLEIFKTKNRGWGKVVPTTFHLMILPIIDTDNHNQASAAANPSNAANSSTPTAAKS